MLFLQQGCAFLLQGVAGETALNITLNIDEEFEINKANQWSATIYLLVVACVVYLPTLSALLK